MAINKRTCVDLVFLLFLVASFLFVGEVYGHSTSTSIDRETTLTGFGKEYNQTVVNFNTEPLRDGYYGSSGDYQSKFSDDFGKLARRQLREDMHEKKVAATLKRDDEVIVKLENAPIKRTNSVDSAVLGKYSVCRKENENVNADSTVRLMRDQLIMARAFISIAITKNRNNLAQELQSRIKEVQRALGEATTDADLPRSASERIKALNQALSKAKEQLYDCKLMTTKLRAMLQSADEQARSSKKQSTFLSQLAAKTIPNGIHCLSLRLTIEYYLLPLEKRKFPRSQNLENPNLYHYALFSDNVLAASVVVNSTIMNAKVGHGKHRNQVKLEHGLEFGSFWDTCSCRYPWPVWRSLYAIVDV